VGDRWVLKCSGWNTNFGKCNKFQGTMHGWLLMGSWRRNNTAPSSLMSITFVNPQLINTAEFLKFQ
jgi:hypothetical protein